MIKLSIITAVSKSSIPYLDQAWDSIKQLDLPDDWEIEWLLQQDDDDDTLDKEWFSDPVVKFEANGRRLRAAGTRNQALIRATGQYVLPFDADDLLDPNSIHALSKGFLDIPQTAWSAGRWDELYEDGSTKEWRHPKYEGSRPVGWLNEEINKTGKTPFAMTPVMYKRKVLLSVGGWPAYPEWEDTILLIEVSNKYPGWATDKLVGLYRRHDKQTSRSDWFQDSERKSRMYDYIKRIGNV